MSNTVVYKELTELVPKFRYASEQSAGLDIAATENYKLSPGESVLIGTGFCIDAQIKLPEPLQIAVQVWPRSGLSVKHNLETGAGLIDADYRGEIKIHLYNHGHDFYQIKKGDYIAQLVFCVVIPPAKLNFVSARDINSSERGEKGFGSSGLA